VKILHLYVSPEHNFYGHHGKPPGDTPMQEVPFVECVSGKGIPGDRFFEYKPDYKGQITFFSQKIYQDLCERFQVFDKSPMVLRRNVIVDEIDLNSLIGKDFELQGIRFHGCAECSPCYWMNQAFHEGAEEALQGNGGLRAKILTDGTLRSG